MIGSCTNQPINLFQINVEADFIIPAGLNSIDTYYFTIPRVPTRIRSYWSGDVADFGAILPANAFLTSRFNNIDWSLVREVYIFAVSPSNPENRKEIFYQNIFEPNRQRELRLFNSLPDVKDILSEEYFNIEVRINFRGITPVEIDTRMQMNFNVHGKSE